MAGELRTVEEIDSWFFDEYVPRWNELARDPAGDPAAILRYWTPPLHFSVTDRDPSRAVNGWATTEEEVLAVLSAQHRPLRAAGYTDTVVLDRHIFVHTPDAAGIDAIWSRRSATAEIERLLAHFEVRKDQDGHWRVTSIVAQATSEQTIAAARAAGLRDRTEAPTPHTVEE
ncbi:DUF6841 family protein [Nocardia brasiliensis]